MPIQYGSLVYETGQGVGRLTLNRPGRLNAMDQPAVCDLDAVSQRIAEDRDLRLVVISGAGRAFCSGIDLKALSIGAIDMDYHRTWERALRRFETMDKIVICLIHGYALGGGLQLALAADIRVTTPSARIGLPAIREGLIPGMGTFRLARYVGLGRAKRLILSGDLIDGDEALRIGLVDHLVDDDDPRAGCDALMDRYMTANSQGCRLAKEALGACFDLDFDCFLTRYMALQERAMDSDDFREAMVAYREDRDPEWR